MGPSVSKLRRQPVPRAKPERALERVVVGSADAVELENVAEMGVGDERPSAVLFVYLAHQIQLPSLAPDVPNLQNGRIAERFLYLQVVIIEVRGAEVLADRISAQALRVGGGSAVGVAAGLHSRKDGVAACLDACIDVPVIGRLAEPVRAIRGNRESAERVALNPLRRRDGRPEIQERVQVDLVEENAYSAAHHEIGLPRRLIGEADSRRKVVLVRRENGVDPGSLNFKSHSRNEVRYVLSIAVERPEVFVAHTKIQIQFTSYLPAVLEVQIERVHCDKALRVSHGDR